MKKIAFFLLVIPILVSASGRFNLIRTLWIDIAYQDNLERHAMILYKKADEIYQRISREFGFTLDPRPIVYLIDKTDIANGYANPLNNVIVIYPNEIDPYVFTPNYEEWVTFCFTHELTHLFLANSFSPYISFTSFFGHAVPAAIQSVLTPFYLHEGLAVYYETFISDSGRGKDRLFADYMEEAKKSDLGLRYASSLNTRRWLAGGPSYVQGFSLLNSIERKYGHEKVMELVRKFTQDPLAGFYRALKNANLQNDLEDWLAKPLQTQEDGRISEILLRASKLDINAWRIYYIAEKYNGEEAIYYYDTFAQEHVKLFDVNNIVSFSINRTRMIALARYVQEKDSTVSRLYLYSGTVKDLGIEKVVDLSWINDFELAMIRQDEDGKRFIDLYDLRDRRLKRIFGPDKSIVPLQITASDDRIVFTAKIDGQIDLFMIDKDRSIKRLTNDKYSKLSPKLLSNELYFCADYSGRFDLYLLDINNKQISKMNIEGSISGIVLNNLTYSFKVVPGGFGIFKQQSQPEVKMNFEIHGFELSTFESAKMNDVQSYYDSMKLRFVLPFPYLSFDSGRLDYGAGFATGFWDDLMDTYMIFGCVWSWENWIAQFMIKSQSDSSLTVQFDQKNNLFTLSTELNIPFYINKRLMDEKLNLILGMNLDQTLFLNPRVRVLYSLGKVGGKLHQVTFSDVALWSDVLPNVSVGFAKAFLFKDSIFRFYSQVRLTDFQYGADLIIPGPSVNFGSIDGFWAIDSVNFSPGFSVKIDNDKTVYDIRLKTTFNCHVIYQVPIPFSVTVGVREGKGYLNFSVEDVLSLFLN